MQSTVAAMILAFAYRCGGSDGIAKPLRLAHRLPVSFLDRAVVGTPADSRIRLLQLVAKVNAGQSSDAFKPRKNGANHSDDSLQDSTLMK